MKPNTIEAEHIWEGFKREWKLPSWPTPAELCGRLTKFRQQQASLGKATGAYRPPNPDQKQVENRPYNHAEFMASLQEARRQLAANPNDALAKMIVNLGETLLIERDDNDQPRSQADRLAMKAKLQASRRTAA